MNNKFINDDASLFVVRDINPNKLLEEIDEVMKMGCGKFQYPITDAMRFNAYRRWHNEVPNCIKLITYNGRIIGYLCMLPLKTEIGYLGENHLYGRCTLYEIAIEMLSKKSSGLICFEGAHLSSGFITNRLAWEAYMYAFYDLACTYLYEDEKFYASTKYYAELQSVFFKKTLRLHGFEPISINRNSKKEIYELSLYEKSKSNKSKRGKVVVAEILKRHNKMKLTV